MGSLKPTENSQIFKKLLTAKIKSIARLQRKTALCQEYCRQLDVPMKQAKSGQFEYQQFTFDMKCHISVNRAQKVIDIYTNHINQVEEEINEIIFNEDDIQKTPGLVRLKATQGDPLYDKGLGKIHLEFEIFFNTATDSILSVQVTSRPTIISWFNIHKVIPSFIWVILIATTIIFIKSIFSPPDNYSKKQHITVLKENAERLEKDLATWYRTIKVDNKKNDQLIKAKEEKLLKIRYVLSNAQNITKSYEKQILFLSDRHDYLNSIESQINPGLFIRAYNALMRGDTSVAYKLYEDYKKQGNVSIKDGAKANYEQGVIDEGRLEYKSAYKLFIRSAQLHPENSEYNMKSGFLAHTLGHFNEAIDFYRKASNIALKSLGQYHPSVTDIWNKIGESWQLLGQHDKAIEYIEKALAIDLKVYGEDNSIVADRWNNLALAFHSKGDYEKAIRFYEKALSVYREIFGEKHFNTIDASKNLLLAKSYNNDYMNL